MINRGHESPLFARREVDTPEGKRVPQKTSTDAAYLEKRAVSYVKTCKRTGWDKAPVKTITDAFGVSRSTYHKWVKKYPKARDDCTKEDIRDLFNVLAPLYRKNKLQS